MLLLFTAVAARLTQLQLFDGQRYVALGVERIVLGTAAIYLLERHAHGTEVKTVGRALFFTTVQLLTVSSQIKNPLTMGGRIVDVLLEVWALFVVTAVAGSFAAFFSAVDPDQTAP